MIETESPLVFIIRDSVLSRFVYSLIPHANKKAAIRINLITAFFFGRDGQIRTAGPTPPRRVL